MKKPSPPAVGIDLGTTYSAVAWIDELGRPQTLINGEGEKLTPSAVLFEDDEVIVGKEAIKALATDAGQVARCAKRELGRRVFSKPLGGRQYPPETLEGWILNKLRVEAARQIGRFTKAVITVPAYFDEVRRKATQDAGYMAGLDVLDIINEPTAAAIAYGYQHDFFRLDGVAPESQRILVYDLGGGTFDVTVMEIQGSNFIALSTDGDSYLGGQDWDQRLVDFVAKEFIRQHGADPRSDANALGRLWRDCEDAKRTLSARQKTTIAFDYRGEAIRIEIERAQFEEMTADLLDRTAFTSREALLASELEWSELDRILLVGGATRMPAVKSMMANLAGREPDFSVSPDEAVAHGAALRAGLLVSAGGDHYPQFKIRNVNSHSLGVIGTDTVSRLKRNAIIIPRNTPLPASASRVFQTQKVRQESILVPVVEGEGSSPEDCSAIGDVVVRELPEDLPAQTPIDVKFRYEENGRLSVAVKVEGTDRRLRHELKRDNSLSQEQLDEWRRHIAKLPPLEEQQDG